MSRIVAVAPALPEYSYAQDDITAELSDLITHDATKRAVLARFHSSSGIGRRHTVLPLEQYRDLRSFGDANDIWIREGTALAARAVTAALHTAGLQPEDVDYLFFTSVTGLAAPSIDARLVPGARVARRTSSACRRSDSAAWPEPRDSRGCTTTCWATRVRSPCWCRSSFCSLTLQHDDDSVANFVASGLFGDGAAAVVVAGAERAAELGLPGPDILGSRAALYPDSESVIGFDVGGTGFRIVLTAAVSDTIDANIADDVRGLLADHSVDRADVSAWVAHPGGPRVLEAFERGLDLERADLVRFVAITGCRRQPVVVVGAARAVGHARATAGHARGAVRARARGHERVRAAEVGGMTLSVVLFTVFVLLTGVERLVELVISKRNAAWAFARGGVESGRGHFPAMVAAPHRLAAGRARRGVAARPPVHPRARLADARDRAALPGRSLLGDRVARPPVEHPGDRRARDARSAAVGRTASRGCGIPTT